MYLFFYSKQTNNRLFIAKKIDNDRKSEYTYNKNIKLSVFVMICIIKIILKCCTEFFNNAKYRKKEIET